MLTAAYTVRIERHEVGDGGLAALSFSTRDGAPLVFVLHGMLSRKERHLDLCLRLADAGFRAVAFDAPNHGERTTSLTTALYGDRQSAEFLAAFIPTVTGAVADVATLAGYFGAERYGVVGHSMGGYEAIHCALADPRAAAVVNVSGSIVSEEGAVTTAEMAEVVRAGDILARAAELRPRPVLLLHGDADETVPVAGARRLYAALTAAYADVPDAVALQEFAGWGHDWRPEMADAAVAFFRRHLSP